MTLAPPRPALDPADLAAATRDVRRAGSLTFLIGDAVLTYRAQDGDVLESDQPDGDAAVRLTPQSWSDLLTQVRTPIGLLLAGELAFERGGFDQLAAWDRTLRLLHNGTPPFDPDRADLKGRDPRAAMTLDDSDEDLREQLQTMGYLLVKGVFSAQEMSLANAEVDRLAAAAAPGDNESWFVDTDEGQQLCRLVYATRRSAVLQFLEQDPRIRRLGTLTDPTLKPAPDRMEGTAVLLKVPGRTRGLSNIPWHQDCGMGGHAIFCPSVSMGIQLTGSSPETGNLLMVPGSHGQTLHHQWDKRADIPVVEVNTEPGDVTVHIQDVMHASPQPTAQGGRRTMYVTHYPGTLWDSIGPGEAYNDLIRNRTAEVGALA
ncbi:MAG: hypothetical protein JWO22_3067 [Frankiales bacterium]|nr:hypothetical protein [Frankiales bacterium]